MPLLDSVVIVPAFDTPAPPAPPAPPAGAAPPFPPLIAPLLDRVVIVLAFDTPTPPAPPVIPPPPFPPLIVPPDWLVSVVIAHVRASTPSPPGPPEMLPLPVTVMAPPLLRTGPVVDVEMVWFDPEHAASARSGAAKAPRATSEAPASSEAREIRAPPLECRDVGKAFNLASARAPAAFLHAHDALLPKSKRFLLTDSTHRKTCLLREVFVSSQPQRNSPIRFGIGL